MSRRRPRLSECKTWPDFERGGFMRRGNPDIESGFRQYGSTGRMMRPGLTNLCVDPFGVNNTVWPDGGANVTVTRNQDIPVPWSGNLGVTKCVKIENDGTGATYSTGNTTVSASKDYWMPVSVYAPTVGGNITVQADIASGAHTFTLGTITAANSTWARQAALKSPTVAGEVAARWNFIFAGGTASVIYVTMARIGQETVLSPDFSPSDESCSWASTVNASTSSLVKSLLGQTVAADLFNTSGTVAARITETYRASTSGSGSWYYWAMKFAAQNTFTIAMFSGGGYYRTTANDNAAHVTNCTNNVVWAAGATNHVVSRWTDAALDCNVNGTDAAQVPLAYPIDCDTTEYIGVGPQNTINQPLACIGPLIRSVTTKTQAWVDAIQANGGAAYSSPQALYRLMQTGDRVYPLAGDSCHYEKVAGDAPFDLGVMVFDGNSLTQGSNGTVLVSSYPTQMLAYMYGVNWPWRIHNVAEGSQTTTAMIADAAVDVDALYDAGAANNICIAWEGYVDLRDTGGITKEAAYANLVAYAAARQAAGWQVVLLTLPPNKQVSAPADYETSRAWVNGQLRANAATICDALADIAADSRFDEADDADNTTYCADKLHMTSAGYGVVAGIVKAAVDTLL